MKTTDSTPTPVPSQPQQEAVEIGQFPHAAELRALHPHALDPELRYDLYAFRNAEEGSVVWHAFEMTRYTHGFLMGDAETRQFVKVANYNFQVLRFIQLWTMERDWDRASSVAAATQALEKRVEELEDALKTIEPTVASLSAQIICPIDNTFSRMLKTIRAALSTKGKK